METILKKLVKAERAEQYASEFTRVFVDHIPDKIEQAHFLTQVIFESGGFRVLIENMNYSAERLMKIFPKQFSNLQVAKRYERNPRAIGNRVYANRNGNGPESSGDGFRYRGRGFIQVTFKDSYRAFSEWIGNPVVMLSPGLVATTYPIDSALWFWESRKLGRFAVKLGSDVSDYKDSVSEITYRVNGSRRSVDERFKVFESVFEAMGLG